MAIIALVSAKGSPGVTTSALACALAWHRRLVLAECDPAGGSILAGYLGGQLDGPRGIGELAVGELRDGNLETAFWSPAGRPGRPAPGAAAAARPRRPGPGGSVAPLWQRLRRLLRRPGPRHPRLRRARRLWPAARDRATVAAAAGRLGGAAGDPGDTCRTSPAPGRWSRRSNGTSPSTGCRRAPCGCCWSATGTGRREISRALKLPVIARLPHDPRTAEVLALGGTVRAGRPLMRAAAALEVPIGALLERRRARLAWPVQQGVPDAV